MEKEDLPENLIDRIEYRLKGKKVFVKQSTPSAALRLQHFPSYLLTYRNMVGHVTDVMNRAIHVTPSECRLHELVYWLQEADKVLLECIGTVDKTPESPADDRRGALYRLERKMDTVGELLIKVLTSLPQHICRLNMNTNNPHRPVSARGVRLGGPLCLMLQSAIANTVRQTFEGRWSISSELKKLEPVLSKLEVLRLKTIAEIDSAKSAR